MTNPAQSAADAIKSRRAQEGTLHVLPSKQGGATSTLPFAPLLHDELNRRAAEEREACGYRCVSAVRVFGGTFTPVAIDYLRRHATLADAYLDAALARCVTR